MHILNFFCFTGLLLVSACGHQASETAAQSLSKPPAVSDKAGDLQAEDATASAKQTVTLRPESLPYITVRGVSAEVHGGVISALLDAAMTSVLFSIGVVAVTVELTVRFVAPVCLNRVAAVRAVIDRPARHRIHYVRAELEQDERVMARAWAKFQVRTGCRRYP